MRSIVTRSLASVVLLPFLASGCKEDAPVQPPGGAGPPDGVRLVLDSRSIAVNQDRSTQIGARLVDGAGRTVTSIPLAFRAASGSPLSVSASGVVTGVRAGAGRVQVLVDGAPIDSLDVDVFGRPEGTRDGSATLGMRPFGVAVSRQGVVYVTQLDAAQVSVTGVGSRSISGSIAVGAVPTGVTFSHDGATAYVTNQHSGNVGVVDVETGVQVDTIDVPGDPFVVRVGPTGDKLYVAGNSNTVTIVDVATRTVLNTVPVGIAPNSFAVNLAETRIYVASAYGATVTEMNTATDAVTRTFTVNGTPQELVMSKDGTELYVANEAGWVDVIDLASGEVAERITLAGGGFGAALSPDQVHLYVSVPSAGVVQVVNTQTRRVTHTIQVGGRPRRIAFDYHGGRAVVANEAGGVEFVR